MPFVSEFVEYKPWEACRILVIVDNNGNSEVIDYLNEIKSTHYDEFRKIVRVLKDAARIGPRKIHDKRLCKSVGEVYEFKAQGKMLRVFWFYSESINLGNRKIDTIILTHAARPDKNIQNREIKRAERIAAQYKESPFEEIEA